MKAPITQTDADELYQLLERLYREQASDADLPAYLVDHARPVVIKHHVSVFSWYAQYLPEAGAILDWGCHHGPDSCFLRREFGDRYDLSGCDFFGESEYRVFREYARSRYTRLTGVNDLPYPDNTFDVVVGTGVLEHTAMDVEALKGVYRVLKPDGLLIISYLPYYLSWEEWYRRCVQKSGFHRRLYGRREIQTLLKRGGFYPLDTRFHTFLPNPLRGKWSRRIKGVLRRLRSSWFSHSALCCVARKVEVM